MSITFDVGFGVGFICLITIVAWAHVRIKLAAMSFEFEQKFPRTESEEAADD